MMGDEINPGAAPFLALLSGSEVALEAFVELVGLGGGGVLELDDDVDAMSPAPPLPPAVRGTSVG
jgi:hypothetical protein